MVVEDGAVDGHRQRHTHSFAELRGLTIAVSAPKSGLAVIKNFE